MGTTPTYPMQISGIMLAGITLVNQSETFDPAQGVKRWTDPSKGALPAGDPANYMVFDPVSGTEVPLKITNAVAATANVPAIYPPAPPIAPTPATMTLATASSVVLAVNPGDLSTQAQAEAVAAAVGAALNLVFSVQVPSTSFADHNGLYQAGFVFNANGETRQQFQIVAPGVAAANTGQLLIAQNANGVGSPGNWALNAANQIVWNAVPVPQAGPNTPRDIPFPVRALLPAESFRSAGLPGLWEVISSTSFDPDSPATAGQVGQVQSDVNLIKQLLGING